MFGIVVKPMVLATLFLKMVLNHPDSRKIHTDFPLMILYNFQYKNFNFWSFWRIWLFWALLGAPGRSWELLGAPGSGALQDAPWRPSGLHLSNLPDSRKIHPDFPLWFCIIFNIKVSIFDHSEGYGPPGRSSTLLILITCPRRIFGVLI